MNEYRILDNDRVRDLVVIHYGAKKYRKDLVKKIRNQPFIKPAGGLWTSPINSTWGWKEWCKANNFREYDMTTISF